MIAYLHSRLTERSTWIGLGAAGAGAVTTVGNYLTPDQLHIIALSVVVSGVVAALLPTGGKDDA